MIRTPKFALRYDPSNSQAIGYYATQHNAAYNTAVDVLNREPEFATRPTPSTANGGPVTSRTY